VATLAAVPLDLETVGASASEPVFCTIQWDGGAGTQDWNHAQNWDADRLPGASDVACVFDAGNEVHYTTDVPTQVKALQADNWIVVSAGQLELTDASYALGARLDAGEIAVGTSLEVQELDQNGGVLSGAGDVVVSGFLRWAAGAQWGPGRTIALDVPDDDFDGVILDGPGVRVALDRPLDAWSGLQMTGDPELQLVGSGSVLQLGGVSSVTGEGDGEVSSNGRITGSGYVALAGELIVGDATLDVDVPFTSGPEASVRVLSPESLLAFYGGGAQQAGFFMEAGTAIDLRGGTYTFAENAPITAFGDGTFRVAEATTDATVLGTYAVGVTDVLEGSLRLSEGAEPGVVELDEGGTLEIRGAVTATSVAHEGGTVTGDGELTVTGDYRWAEGTQSGAGFTTVAGTISLEGRVEGRELVRTIDGRDVTGTHLSWVDGGVVRFANDGGLTSETESFVGTLPALVDGTGTFAPGDLTLDGTQLTVKSTFVTMADTTVTLDSAASFLDLQGGGEHFGTLTDGEADPVGINLGGTHVFHPGSQVTSADTPFGTYQDAQVTVDADQFVVGDINSSGTLHLKTTLANVGEVVNHGVLIVEEGSTLWTPRYVQPSDGTTTLSGPNATILIQGDIPVVIEAGELVGEGVIDGSLVNGSLVAPAFGDIRVTGDYAQEADARLDIAVADGVDVDELIVTGTAALDGTLSLAIQSAPTQVLWLVSYGNHVGTFATVEGGEACADIAYEDTAVFLVPQPCIVIDAPIAGEGDGDIVFDITLTEPASRPVRIDYATADGDATSVVDYAAASGFVVIGEGGSSGSISVEIVDDDEAEADESFMLVVTAQGGTLEAGTIHAQIRDDDLGFGYAVRTIPVRGPTWLGAINDTYVVGTTSFDADTGFGFYANHTTGTFSYFPDVLDASDINDSNQLVGTCGVPLGGWSCFRSDKTNHRVVGGSPAGLNDNAVLVGDIHQGSGNTARTSAAIWSSPTASPTTLAGLPGFEHNHARDITNSGIIIGSASTAGRSDGWVQLPGGSVVPLRFGDLAINGTEGVNESGLVVGDSRAADGSPGSLQAWAWTEESGMVPLWNGWVGDVNERGDVVGGDASSRGLLRRGGKTVELTKTLGDNPAGWVITGAFLINDRGVIAATAWRPGSGGTSYVTLLPDGNSCDVCIDRYEVQETKYPTGQWIDANGQIVDGNDARLLAVVKNSSAAPETVTVTFEDDLGEPVGDPQRVTVAAGASVEVSAEWDSKGLAWDGAAAAGPIGFAATVTDASGTATSVEQVTVQVNPRPVVTVHGLWSDASTWASYQQFLAEAHPGWRGYAVNTMDTASFVPNLVSENAGELTQYVTRIRSLENAWQVDLVAHSMGGLISRYYIQNFMPTNDGKTAVANLVMLGTPNAGSPCANLAVIPATYELRPDVVAQFNAEVTDRKGIPFSVAVGVHTPVTCHSPVTGDDVVPVPSAQAGMTDTQLFEIAHTSMTGSRDLFRSFVLPRLRPATAGARSFDGGRAAAVAAEDGAVPTAAVEGAAPATEPDPLLALAGNEEVGAGASVLLPVEVLDGAQLGALAVANGEVEVALIDPNGKVAALRGVDATTMPGFRSISVEAPVPGTWMLRLRNTGTANVTVPVSAWITGSSIELTADATPTDDGQVAVTATATALLGARPEMTALLTDQDGAERTITLFDDGAHGDGAAGDGSYRGLTGPIATGRYGVVATGVWSSGLTRSTTAAVRVTAGGDAPGNDPPVAQARTLSVPKDTKVFFQLFGFDPEGRPLTYEIVTRPAHGALGGKVPSLNYQPAFGYRGADSFTYRVYDGELWSAPATITIDVTKAPVELWYTGPYPTSGVFGTTFRANAKVVDPLGNGLAYVPMEYVWGGTTYQSGTTNAGTSSADIPLNLALGTHTLTIRFPGNEDYLPREYTQQITIGSGASPKPSAWGPYRGEAGYPILLQVEALDPDGNAIKAEWDVDGDGDVDVTVPLDERRQWARTPWTYPSAFTGTASVKVTDSTGNVGTATASVTIAPHRPLGATSRLLTDGQPVEVLGLSDDGRYVLYRGVDHDPDSQPPLPLIRLDRTTGTSTVVSILPDGTQIDGGSPVLSDNGRFVVFRAVELAGGFYRSQLYVRDIEGGTSEKVSLNSSGEAANRGAEAIGISDDGRAIAFVTNSTNMVGANLFHCGTNGSQPCEQVYVRDRQARTTELISRDATGAPTHAGEYGDLSADGRFVLFSSRRGLEVADRTTGTAQVVPVTSNGAVPNRSFQPQEITDDGNVVLFESESTNHLAADTSIDPDVYRFDRRTQQLQLISVDAAGVKGNDASYQADMSEDGNVVVFSSEATNLASPASAQNRQHMYLRDLVDGTTTRISIEPRDRIEGDRDSVLWPYISCDASVVVFQSDATNLVPGDVENWRDSFLHRTGLSRPCGSTPPPPPPPPPVNSVPTAAPVSVATAHGAAVGVTLAGEDADGDALTFEVVTTPANGALSGTAPALTYTPAAGFAGSDTFTYRVGDGTAWSAPATATIEVAAAPVNQAPAVTLTAPAAMDEGSAVAVTASATDADGDELTYTWSTSEGLVTAGAAGTATLTVDDGPASVTVTVVVSDGETSTTATATVAVANVAPTAAAAGGATTAWGLPVSFSATTSDVSTADRATLTRTWDFGDGTPAVTGSGATASATHAYAAPGTYTATLTVDDGDGGVATDTVSVTVARRPVSLVLDARSGVVGQAQVSATLRDGLPGGAPLAGRTVTFVIDGVPQTAVTDGTGVARAIVGSLTAGRYPVWASVSADAAYAEATTPPVTLSVTNSSSGRVTGGVRFADGSAGFTVQVDSKGKVKGELQFQRGTTAIHVRTFTTLGVSADLRSAWFSGTADDGRPVIVQLEDRGSPGTRDVFRLWVAAVELTPGGVPIVGGDLQIHAR